MGVTAAANGAPAGWLLGSSGDWWDLVRWGPPGFAAYVRVAFEPNPDPVPGSPGPSGDEDTGMRRALAVLAGWTSTPDTAYAAVWEGWIGGAPAPVAPRLLIPNRTMLLLTGPVAELRDAPARAWGAEGRHLQEPHLVWPADRAWCVACEVDEEIEFSVGCSTEAVAALAQALPGAVRRAERGADTPLYRPSDS